ncbi:hypothetical protein [Pelagibacterium luteolum]|uniref:Uncharacterized protein n=1 Tax=Pelagibacterium luteolum TaxID=440168 RepID=A0A1G7SCJ0_9HYPH|nr:hypothetical protein [Pelagibacterium luteolum]SDG20634.1 hypothetical protein SAMN04487974_101425 [Pelagibacterium luteolum]
MDSFDPLPQAPLAMPKQQIENKVTLRIVLSRFFALFVRDTSSVRREL